MTDEKKEIIEQSEFYQNSLLDEELNEEDLLYTQLNMDAANQYVVFSVGKEDYGIPILSVQEIISLPNLTRIPNTPEYIPGVINLRGTIIPLYELRRKFLMEVRDLGNNTVVIIIQAGKTKKTIGLIVDNVSDVLSIPEESIQVVPDISTNIDTEYIDKIGQVGNRMIIIIKMDSFLTERELKQLEITANETNKDKNG